MPEVLKPLGQVGRVSDASVAKGTGKEWAAWVALGFQLATGRRREGESLKGDFTVGASRTFASSAAETWRFLASREGTQVWLSPLGSFKLRKGAVYER